MARILGNERGFVRIWRSWRRSEPETAVSRILLGLQNRVASLKTGDLGYKDLFNDCVAQFEAGDRAAGAVRLSELMDPLPHDIFNDEMRRVLRMCVTRLRDERARDDIDILLTLTVLQIVARGRHSGEEPGLA